MVSGTLLWPIRVCDVVNDGNDSEFPMLPQVVRLHTFDLCNRIGVDIFEPLTLTHSNFEQFGGAAKWETCCVFRVGCSRQVQVPTPNSRGNRMPIFSRFCCT
jgi:hypothetical protein